MQPLNDSGRSKPSVATRILIFLTFFVLIQLVPFMLTIIRGLPKAQLVGRSFAAAGYILGYVVLIIVMVVCMKRVTDHPFWHRPSRNDLAYLFIAFVIFLAVEMVLSGLNSRLFGQTQTTNNAVIISLLKSDRWIFYLLMFSGIFLSPIIEELLFRGYWINSFFKPGTLWLPVITSGLIFSIAHASSNIVSFLIYACLGAILAFIYRRTDNLVTSIGLHMLNNLMAMSIMAVMLK